MNFRKFKEIFRATLKLDNHKEDELVLLDAPQINKDLALKELKRVGLWRVNGYVLTCADTANMVIVADGKVRLLVTSERKELMEPTRPCFQANLNETIDQLKIHEI